MKHPKLIRSLAAALLPVALVATLAAGASAKRINYGALWHGLTGSEKELLLIGYARGLKSAESKVQTALWNEAFYDQDSRRRLLECAANLSAGLENTEDLRSVVECLDTFYADAHNQFIDWTSLVGLARSKLAGASEEKIEAELAQLRRCADHLEELLREGPR